LPQIFFPLQQIRLRAGAGQSLFACILTAGGEMPAPFEIQVLSIDPVSWTPVAAAFECNSFLVKIADPANPVKFLT
jgi:hypothetical protein